MNTDKIAKILNSCDFAIVTPSVILHEVIFLEKPFLAIKTAENQDEMCGYLNENNYLCLVNMNSDRINSIVRSIG